MKRAVFIAGRRPVSGRVELAALRAQLAAEREHVKMLTTLLALRPYAVPLRPARLQVRIPAQRRAPRGVPQSSPW